MDRSQLKKSIDHFGRPPTISEGEICKRLDVDPEVLRSAGFPDVIDAEDTPMRAISGNPPVIQPFYYEEEYVKWLETIVKFQIKGTR